VPADAVLLLAFGGPTRPEEIRPFLANVTRGRAIPTDRLEEVARHYEAIGGRSPLAELTFCQARKLEEALAVAGPALPVHVGMRNWEPYLEDTLARMVDAGVRRAVGLILSPHASEASRDRYVEQVDAARRALGARAPEIRWADAWHTHPLFVTAVGDAAVAALVTIPAASRAAVCRAPRRAPSSVVSASKPIRTLRVRWFAWTRLTPGMRRICCSIWRGPWPDHAGT